MQAHVPVLLDEAMRFLNPQPGGRFIDATFGAGGHTAALLDLVGPLGQVLALDQDETAIANGSPAFQSYGSRLVPVHSNFRNLAHVAAELGFAGADGVLADIGVSSMMLDDATRGFSFMREGTLDMRMDRSQPLTAADVLNTYSEKDIADIIYKFGEERRSRPIARSIVGRRPLVHTTDLVAAVTRVMGGPRYGHIHPATRTFQALRIFVNNELESLETFLDSATAVVRPGGRVVVIAFHSLEDRIVKNKFRSSGVPGTVLTKKVIKATDEEVRRNPRSRSAHLRAWERT